MKKIWQKLLLIERFTIQTKRSKENILNRVSDLYGKYHGRVRENGFSLAVKPYSHEGPLFMHNSFVPFAHARIGQEGSITTVSVTITMHPVVCLFVYFVYLLSALCFLVGLIGTVAEMILLIAGRGAELSMFSLLVLFPLFFLFLHFVFFRPAKCLRATLEDLLKDPDDA